MVCGQTEQLYFDPTLEMEYYSDDPDNDSIKWWVHTFEFPSGKVSLRVCGECSEKPGDKMFEEYQTRVLTGEIPFFH